MRGLETGDLRSASHRVGLLPLPLRSSWSALRASFSRDSATIPRNGETGPATICYPLDRSSDRSLITFLPFLVFLRARPAARGSVDTRSSRLVENPKRAPRTFPRRRKRAAMLGRFQETGCEPCSFFFSFFLLFLSFSSLRPSTDKIA